MRDFVKKLIQRPATTSDALSVILGSSGARFADALADLNRPRLRIGFWPIIASSAEEAMGIATVLASLIEHWQGVRVYRLFTRIEETLTDYAWSIDQSQFTVDDWTLEGLDENIAIWGALDWDNDQWKLTLQIESDFSADSDEVGVLAYKAGSLSKLIEMLPGAAGDIANLIEAGSSKIAFPTDWMNNNDEQALKDFLAQLFQWELGLLLHLWRVPLDDEVTMANKVGALAHVGQTLDGEFAAWAVATAAARAMLPMFAPVNDLLVPLIDEVFASLKDYATPAIILATALFRLNRVETAFNILEDALETHTSSPELWLGVADLYRLGGHYVEAIDSYQQAIENDAISSELYNKYGELLVALHSQGIGVETFILADSSERATNLISLEAIEAFEGALTLDPTNINALYGQITQLINIEDSGLWRAFQRLVDIDGSGEHVRNVIDSLYPLDDISPAIQILEKAVSKNPGRFDLFLSLGAAYLVAEDEERAHTALEKARQLTTDSAAHAEIDRLLLVASDPNFEQRLGEITDLVGAGSNLSIRDAGFLEAVLEKAPKFAEAYLLLAKAYQTWREPEAVLETLLDGQRSLPEDPDILVMLAQALWESGERELALDYLNQGLGASPQHVPLLSLTGRYLFENGQEDAAKIFLVRAEAISPRHPALNAVRTHIARSRG